MGVKLSRVKQKKKPSDQTPVQEDGRQLSADAADRLTRVILVNKVS